MCRVCCFRGALRLFVICFSYVGDTCLVFIIYNLVNNGYVLRSCYPSVLSHDLLSKEIMGAFKGARIYDG